MEGTLNQPYVFAAAMYGGMLAGLLYLFFQAIRRLFRMGKWFTIVLDGVFIVFLFSVTALSMYLATHMQLRPYYFVGIGLGFAIFLGGVSPLCRYIYNNFVKFWRKGVDKRSKKDSNRE